MIREYERHEIAARSAKRERQPPSAKPYVGTTTLNAAERERWHLKVIADRDAAVAKKS